MMGVPHDECNSVGSLVAIKTIVNEFAAYAKLSEMVKAKMISVSRTSLTIKIKINTINLLLFVDRNVLNESQRIHCADFPTPGP